eukprot:2981918-Amphidinium_carterae.1
MAAVEGNRFVVRHIVCDLGVPESALDAVSGHWRDMFCGDTNQTFSGTGVYEDITAENCWELHTRIGCAAHAAHNALKWSLARCRMSKEVVKSAFVAMASIRNCVGSAFEFVGIWLDEVLDAVGPLEPMDRETLEAFYVAVGADPEIVDGLVEYELRYEDGRIKVSRDVLGRDDFMGTCASILLACWNCEPFVESRWVSVGASSRSFLRAECTGMGACFRWARGRDLIKDFYYSGYSNVSMEAKYFMSCAGLVSIVPEHFLASILADNRVPLHLNVLIDGLRTDADYVQSLSDVILHRILDGVGSVVSVEAYRSDIYHAIATAVAYVNIIIIEFRVIQPASEYPWRFCTQSMEASIDEIINASGPLSVDHVTARLQRVASAGCGQHLLKEVITLLAQCSWTSHLAERLHASAATCHRVNPEVGVEGLAMRAFSHMHVRTTMSASPIARETNCQAL